MADGGVGDSAEFPGGLLVGSMEGNVSVKVDDIDGGALVLPAPGLLDDGHKAGRGNTQRLGSSLDAREHLEPFPVLGDKIYLLHSSFVSAGLTYRANFHLPSIFPVAFHLVIFKGG